MGYVADAVGGVVGAVGQIMSSQAAASASKYNAKVNERNAGVATQNAAISGQAGSQQATIQSLKTRASMGDAKTSQAGAGMDVNSGSAVDVQDSIAKIGELDALTIRSNAVKEAYGYATQATNFKSEAALDRFEASNKLTQGYFDATTTLLGSGSKASSSYESYKKAGALFASA